MNKLYSMEPVMQSTLELITSVGFIKIMLLVWSPLILIGLIWFVVKYYKNNRM